MADDSVPSHTRADRDWLRVEEALRPVFGLIGRLELLCIIYPIEGLQRLWYHLDPRVYSERLRIRRVTEGRRPRAGDRFVLFVFYGRDSIPAFTRTVIDAIARRGLNLVISTNATITPALREDLQEKACLLIERADLGRDFGGYKDGIGIIQQRFGTPERLIILNDSLFYFERGLDEFLAAFDGEEDLYAMTEVFEHHYHLGSFALSFGRSVLQSRPVRRFWQGYRPISTRRWAVHKGEVGLTQTLMRAGFRPRVLYHGARLLPHLLQLDSRRFLNAIGLLPVALRRPLYVEYDELMVQQRTSSLSALASLSRGMQRFEGEARQDHPELRSANVRQLLALNHDVALTYQEQESRLAVMMRRKLVSTITAGNQMHVGGFLFRRFLGMPAIKRDVFFREVFKLEEVENILVEFSEPQREEIVGDMRQKGSQVHFKGLARILSRHGSI